MALRICSDEERHTQHRWIQGEYEPFCPGRYTAEDGEWLAEPSSRRHKLSGRVHFYLPGEPRSICGYGWRAKGALPFDPEGGLTTKDDPRFGEPQYRTPCTHCTRATAGTDHHGDGDRA